MGLIPTRLERHLQPDRHRMTAPFAAGAAPLPVQGLCGGGLDRGSPLLEFA